MKSFISILLSLAITISGFFGSLFAEPEKPVASTEQSSVTDLVYVPDKTDIELFNAVNKAREASGKEPLQLDTELCKLAYIRAQEQAVSENHGHIRPDGSHFITVFSEYNYNCKTAGENIIVMGNPNTYSKEKAVSLWLNSPSHKSNMLNDKWIKTGTAVINNKYCVQLFVC